SRRRRRGAPSRAARDASLQKILPIAAARDSRFAGKAGQRQAEISVRSELAWSNAAPTVGNPTMRSVMIFAFLALIAAGIVPRLYVGSHGATAAAPAAPPEASAQNQAASSAASYRNMTIQRGSHRHGD